jgi:outer membrane lipoprotein LolB
MKLRYLFLISLLATSACTTVPEKLVGDPELTWQERQVSLKQIQQWRLTGRVGIDTGLEYWNLDMVWKQRGDEYQIFLKGPFGSGKVILTGNSHGVVLKDSEENSYYSDNPGALLYEITGVRMPVESIRYWIVGLPMPTDGDMKSTLDEQGRLARLEQDKWQVNFRRYAQVSGMHLPRKIYMEKPEQELDVRVVIDRWKLGAF